MKPETITVSLEWAKKLKEAGYPQEAAVFWWFVHESKLEGEENHDLDKCYIQGYREQETEHDTFRNTSFAAPTAEEILRRLPETVEGHEVYSFWLNRRMGKFWRMGYEGEKRNLTAVHEDTLANAAAAIYCYLAENNLLQ